MKQKTILAIVLMAIILAPLWAQGEADFGTTLLSFLPLIVILLIIITIFYFLTRKLMRMEMKDNVRMLMRIISALGLLIVAYNNRLLLSGLRFYSMNTLLLEFSFYIAVAGILMLIPFLLKIEMKRWIEWLPIVVSIIFYVFAFFKMLEEWQFNDEETVEALKFLFFQFLGYLVAIFFLKAAKKRQEKLPEESSDQTTTPQ